MKNPVSLLFVFFKFGTVHALYKEIIQNRTTFGVLPSSVVQVSVLGSSSNLVSFYNGYDMDDITFAYNSLAGYWTIANKTPRKFLKLNALLNGAPIQLGFENIIDEFSSYNFTMVNMPAYQLGDKLVFVDPFPLFRVGATSFYRYDNRSDMSPLIVGLNVAEIRLYHRIETNMKQLYALGSTKATFLDFITDPAKCSGGSCSESDHSMSDALSKWYRTTSFEFNMQLVALANTGATGMAAGSWMGMHRYVFNGALQTGYTGGYDQWQPYDTFSHEYAHEQGYSHSSGMAYGWDPYIKNIAKQQVASGLITLENVTIEKGDSFIARKKGGVFFVASTQSGVVVKQVSVVYNEANVIINGIKKDITGNYFQVVVSAGKDTVIIAATLADGKVVNKIADVEGFWGIGSAPTKIDRIKPTSVAYTGGNFHIYIPTALVGLRKISYIGYLDGSYLMEGITNNVCYYCYRSGWSDIYTGVVSSRIKSTSIFSVTVRDENSTSYSYSYSSEDVKSGFNTDVLTPVSLKLRDQRLIVEMPVAKISYRVISFRVLIDGAYSFQDSHETDGHACYDCYYFGPGLDIQHIDVSEAKDVVDSTLTYPYVVSSLLANDFATKSNVSIIVRDSVSNRVRVQNYTVSSLLLEQAVAPTQTPTSIPTSRPTSAPTIIPSAPTSIPTVKPSAPTSKPTLAPSPNPTAVPTFAPSRIPTASPTTSTPTSPPTGCWTKHINTVGSYTLVPERPYCTSCKTLYSCQAACMSTPGCVSIILTTPYYYHCELLNTKVYGNGWTDVSYDYCGPSNSPSAVPTKSPADTSTWRPTMPTSQPTVKPTTKPTTKPTFKPTTNPTNVPSANPTLIPFSAPTTTSTIIPSSTPSYLPTLIPTSTPSVSLTKNPSSLPSVPPTLAPVTESPTATPSKAPTATPSKAPTVRPSASPTSTKVPTSSPSFKPTQIPSVKPTTLSTPKPTVKLVPTSSPSFKPTLIPSVKPTALPTPKPTVKLVPTSSPLFKPTLIPSVKPTALPTPKPTVKLVPTSSPLFKPTRIPSVKPTALPTPKPTVKVSTRPTMKPTFQPSARPSTQRPTFKPTSKLTVFPTRTPTKSPTSQPTRKPT